MFIFDVIIGVLSYGVVDKFVKPLLKSTGEKLVDHYAKDLEVYLPEIYGYFDKNLDGVVDGRIDIIGELSTLLVEKITALDKEAAISMAKTLVNGGGKFGYSMLIALDRFQG